MLNRWIFGEKVTHKGFFIREPLGWTLWWERRKLLLSIEAYAINFRRGVFIFWESMLQMVGTPESELITPLGPRREGLLPPS